MIRLAERQAALVAAALATLMAACGGAPAPARTAPITPTVAGEMSPEEAGGMAPPAESGGETGHEHAAPHGGALVELGEEFAHVELVYDAATDLLTAYVLDGEAENALRVAAPQLELQVVPTGGSPATVVLLARANALSGEAVGDTSQFAGPAPALKGVTTYTGRLKAITVRGQSFIDVPFVVPATH